MTFEVKGWFLGAKGGRRRRPHDEDASEPESGDRNIHDFVTFVSDRSAQPSALFVLC